mgnify:FL=1
MPCLSEFYGIAIYLYFSDHNPPHFHAIYGEHEALVAIEDGTVIGGGLPRTAARLVDQWRIERLRELRSSWARAQEPAALGRIEPLQ